MTSMELDLMTCHLPYAFASVGLWTVPLLLIELNHAMKQQEQTLMVMLIWMVLQPWWSVPRPRRHGNMVAERWFRPETCQPLDQRSRRRQQARDVERTQQIETLGRTRARSGRSRRDDDMRKYIESLRSSERHCSSLSSR